MILAILAIVTATFSPAAPTVGDAITVEFSAPVTLEPSSTFEVVSRTERRVVVRTFTPRPFVMNGRSNGAPFNVIIPVRSVLKPSDNLQPAPLAVPRTVPYPSAPFIAIALAALAALFAWMLAWWRARRAVRVVEPPLTAEERFRRAVLALRQDTRHAYRWAALADATRAYLAETRAGLGSELTTTELVPRLQEQERVVADILTQGDVEKFAPWDAPPRDFEEVASRALELAS